MLSTPRLLSWSQWPWWEGKRCPGSEVLGLMPWASSTGLLAFWTGTSVFLTYRDPKWWDFCNELLPNTQGLKDTAFTFLNPTKADFKPPVSMMRSPALAVFLYYLALMGSCGARAKEVPGLLLVQACEVRLLTPE